MKKIILIITLLILNIYLFFIRDQEVALEKIDLNLQYNELGIVFLGLDKSDSLILSINDINILYIIDLKDFEPLKKEINRLNLNIDFVVMNENYDVDLNIPKKIVKESLSLNSITFNNGSYQSINYNNQSLCINNTNCDYVYYTKSSVRVNDNKVLFFNQDIKLPDNLYKEWVDIYKISNSIYTILKVSDTYKVIEIIKNI